MDNQEVLRRFHRALVREIQATSPEHLAAPFTVAEIYQNLVPYRTHRDELGMEMNADYEHALLRLLAGEGEFLTIESRTARQEIREELESPNPNTGMYRDFAAADVRLNPDKIDEALGWIGSEGEGDFLPQHGFAAEELRALEEPSGQEPPAGQGDEDLPEEEGTGLEDAVLSEDEPEVAEEDLAEQLDSGELPLEVPEFPAMSTAEVGVEERETQEPEVTEPVVESEVEEGVGETAEALSSDDVADGEPCPWCRENLPQRMGVNFCPFCGSNVRLVPCPACGEELERTWRFCVACGTEVAS